ncbi:MAG: YlbF family regulator [Prosthecobacter sp.]
MTASPLIQSKIIELCEALVADSAVKDARQQAENFLADEKAVSTYREMANLGRSLHQKQHRDEEPTDDELSRFNALQDKCESDPVITGFLGAQEILSGVAEAVNAFVGKSLESGRVPSAEEMTKKGSCGSGCGCH